MTALTVIDEVVEIDVEPELAHPVVVFAPPLVGENGGVRHDVEGQPAAGGTEGGDVVEQRILRLIRQIDE